MRSSLERLVEANGGGAVEDDVDAGGEFLHVLRADGETRLHQLTAYGDDLLVEVGVVLPHSVEKLPETRDRKQNRKFTHQLNQQQRSHTAWQQTERPT